MAPTRIEATSSRRSIGVATNVGRMSIHITVASTAPAPRHAPPIAPEIRETRPCAWRLRPGAAPTAAIKIQNVVLPTSQSGSIPLANMEAAV